MNDLNQFEILDEKIAKAKSFEKVTSSFKKSKVGRPKKEESEKTKYAGVWLSKESRDRLDLLPAKGGLARKLRFLLDSFYRSQKRDEMVVRRVKKMINVVEQTRESKPEILERECKKICNEIDYLRDLEVIDDFFLMENLSKKNFSAYREILRLGKILL